MLFKDTIEAIKGLNAPSATPLVLNTNRIGLFKVRATTKSDYYYSLNPLDRRYSPLFVHSASSVATLTTALDAALNSNVMVLPVFPNDDSSQSTVTKNIDYADFAYAFTSSANAEHSWVIYYSKAFKQHRVLVDQNLDQIIDIAGTGATTTTTTTTTT
jgi:hypothetical protein